MKQKKYWTDALYTLLLVLFAYFSLLNIAPYQVAIEKLSTPIQGFLAGGIFPTPGWVGAVISFGVATLLWGGIQLVELLPLLIKEDHRFLEVLIRTSSTNHRFDLNKGDDPVLAGLKRVYNRIPLRLIRNLYRMQVFTYCVDFMVVITVYPPAATFSQFIRSLIFGQFESINWLNLALSGVTLFSVEILVLGLIYSHRLNWLFKLSRTRGEYEE